MNNRNDFIKMSNSIVSLNVGDSTVHYRNKQAVTYSHSKIREPCIEPETTGSAWCYILVMLKGVHGYDTKQKSHLKEHLGNVHEIIKISCHRVHVFTVIIFGGNHILTCIMPL